MKYINIDTLALTQGVLKKPLKFTKSRPRKKTKRSN